MERQNLSLQNKRFLMTKKIIIDTDPGVDDAMAILFALSSKELEVLGLTSIFGNVRTELASANALRLLEIAERTDIPVAQGTSQPLKLKFEQPADFVHGKDGFGNINLPEPKGKVVQDSAAQFIVDTILKHPNEVTLIALGPLTNLALALEKNPEITKLVKEVVIMGGAIKINGNVTPVAEANIVNDPHAADIVLTADWPVTLIGLDVTTKTIMTDQDLERLKSHSKKYGDFLYKISQFYLNFYVNSHGYSGICVHDPSTIAYVLEPELFHTQKGPVRVVTDDSIAIAQTIMDERKSWHSENAWTNKPDVNVCLDVNAQAVVDLYFETID